MTSPLTPVPTPARASVRIRVEDVANDLLTKGIGVAMAGFFGYLDYLEAVKAVQSTVRVSIFTGVAVFGVALVITGPVVNTSKSILVVVGPYLPFGRRKDD